MSRAHNARRVGPKPKLTKPVFIIIVRWVEVMQLMLLLTTLSTCCLKVGTISEVSLAADLITYFIMFAVRVVIS